MCSSGQCRSDPQTVCYTCRGAPPPLGLHKDKPVHKHPDSESDCVHGTAPGRESGAVPHCCGVNVAGGGSDKTPVSTVLYFLRSFRGEKKQPKSQVKFEASRRNKHRNVCGGTDVSAKHCQITSTLVYLSEEISLYYKY